MSVKKALITLWAVALCNALAAQLPDRQVTELAREYAARGMSQTQIASELARQGVTIQQLQRIQSNLSSTTTSRNGAAQGVDQMNRLRNGAASNPQYSTSGATGTTLPITVNGAPAATGTAVRLPGYADPLYAAAGGTYEAALRRMADSLLLASISDKKNKIFGHDIFSGKELTFEPRLNIATPAGYLLGPGDEVIIDIWGDSEQTVRQTISPDGTVVLDRLGPVTLGGHTVREADRILKNSLGGIYSSDGGEGSRGTSIKLSLGAIRSIQVHVMGEVERPGTYTVPSLATLFHVLYSAGGVNEIGSLREISVSRDGERIATVDVYSYLLEGRTDVDVALRDGDVVVVPPYRNLVEVTGGVKRPMKYEMTTSESLAQLLDYSGGFAGDAYKDAVTVVRRGGRMQEVHDVGRDDYHSFRMADGDSVAVGSGIRRFSNRIEITGAVFRPGLYASTDPATRSVRTLVAKAEGLMGDAFTARAVLIREKDDYSLEALSVDVGAIVSGVAADIELRNGDCLHIPSIFELREEYTVTVKGAVRKPGEYKFADNLSIEDMIVAAGGLLESASTAKADVYRRIKRPNSISESDARSESFAVPLHIGLDVGMEGGFTVQPFDIITIRTSPGYEKQKSVAVMGEVLFPGDYTLVKREERLSDLVHMSGGALSSAYLQGAKLIRKRAEDEQTRAQSAMKLTRSDGRDSVDVTKLNLEQFYSVGIELDKAMAHPGSDHDLVLTEGDVLFVPEYVGTVSISGAVVSPNTVSYREGMDIRYYIDQAGGFAHRARKKAKIIVYMNGTITRVRSTRGGKIAPGCEIVVPHKSTRGGGRFSVSDLLNMGSSATSAASLITSITGL